jgi:ribosome-binding ATPase YchF (GTP1/OBG family)
VDVGITGPPGAGRTTVFHALLAHRAPSEAGARGAAAIGTIQVQEPRLEVLSEHFRPRKTTTIEIRIHDVCPSLEPGFPKHEIEAMKRLDQLLLVVPGFADPAPEAAARALEGLLEELCLEDLEAVERRLKTATRDKLDERVRRALETAQAALEAGRGIAAALSCEEREPRGRGAGRRARPGGGGGARPRAGAPAAPALRAARGRDGRAADRGA